jgi:hypothetical protein
MSNIAKKFLEVPASIGVNAVEAEAIVVRSNSDWTQAFEMRARPGGHLLPIIDLTGRRNADADCHGPDEQKSVILAFSQRRQGVAAWVRHSRDPAIRLLAYIFVRDKTLHAGYEPDRRECVGYGHPLLLPVTSLREVAERLAAAGHLNRTFFDRLHCCDRCESARLSVREECSSCRSSALDTVTILHHYRCSYSGPVGDFRTEDERLVCPKCERELRHYGTDHERSGTAMRCQACGHFRSEPAVGFVCLDCGTHYDGNSVRTRDFNHYSISETGVALLHAPVARPLHTLSELHQVTPLAIIRELNRALADNRLGFVLCQLGYLNERALALQRGTEAFELAREAFLAGLRVRLPTGSLVCAGRTYDHVFLPDVSKNDSQVLLAKTIEKTAGELTLDLGADVQVLEGNELLPCSS